MSEQHLTINRTSTVNRILSVPTNDTCVLSPYGLSSKQVFWSSSFDPSSEAFYT